MGKPRKVAPRKGKTRTAPAATAPPRLPEPKPRQEVVVTAAKGRPMLTWVGKRPLRHVTAFPAQRVESFDPAGDATRRGGEVWQDWPDRYPRGGLLFHGDNKEVLAHLLANGFRGKVNLVYIDPPFDSGADYVRKVTLRGPKGTAKLDGEAYTLGEQLQYTDIWANDNYLQFMYERLLLKELLAPEGALYLHADTNRGHMLRMLLDEVFGADRFRNEVVWQRTTAHSDTRGRFGEIHDIILSYAKGETPVWNDLYTPYTDDYLKSKYTLVELETGRRYRLGDLTAPGPRPNLEYAWHGVKPPPGRCWAVQKERMDEYERQGRIVVSKTGMPQYKRYLDEMKGVPLQDVWTDIPPVNPMAEERLAYPTQKPENLLDRLIRAASSPGNIVLDCFVGSGTTAAVAQRLGRRWIACDINKGAIQTTSKRLQAIIQEQIEAAGKPRQEELGGVAEGENGGPEPAQLSLAMYRVNDYDLAIQHLEAVELACEHVGVTRTRTDRYFDGTLGRKLVKIVPFNHPLTLLDLEELKRELEARPDEDRAIVAVCLGKEPAADVWIEDWNRLRRGKDAVNRVEVIELRTDPKYGKFFQHQPARARVKAARKADTIAVEIEDFISPSIIERLQGQAGLLKPKIDDWRAMVDCVLIDADYDGKVFRIALSDIPERKTDLVAGRYEIAVGPGPRTVAVKIVDMLGEEVLVTRSIT